MEVDKVANMMVDIEVDKVTDEGTWRWIHKQTDMVITNEEMISVTLTIGGQMSN